MRIPATCTALVCSSITKKTMTRAVPNALRVSTAKKPQAYRVSQCARTKAYDPSEARGAPEAQ